MHFHIDFVSNCDLEWSQHLSFISSCHVTTTRCFFCAFKSLINNRCGPKTRFLYFHVRTTRFSKRNEFSMRTCTFSPRERTNSVMQPTTLSADGWIILSRYNTRESNFRNFTRSPRDRNSRRPDNRFALDVARRIKITQGRNDILQFPKNTNNNVELESENIRYVTVFMVAAEKSKNTRDVPNMRTDKSLFLFIYLNSPKTNQRLFVASGFPIALKAFPTFNVIYLSFYNGHLAVA